MADRTRSPGAAADSIRRSAIPPDAFRCDRRTRNRRLALGRRIEAKAELATRRRTLLVRRLELFLRRDHGRRGAGGDGGVLRRGGAVNAGKPGSVVRLGSSAAVRDHSPFDFRKSAATSAGRLWSPSTA